MAIEIVRCELSDYDAEIRTIRETVFVHEQGVPPQLEMDDRDAICVHVLARVDGEPAGTARLDIQNHGKIGRLAVLPNFRRQGLGQLIMAEIEAIGRCHRLTQLWCHAQTTALPFYQSLDYAIAGPEFLEAGIQHRKMQKSLASPSDGPDVRRA